MLQHLSTRPPTTRSRSSPNPQPHRARYSFSIAVFTRSLSFSFFPALFLQSFQLKSLKIASFLDPKTFDMLHLLGEKANAST